MSDFDEEPEREMTKEEWNVIVRRAILQKHYADLSTDLMRIRVALERLDADEKWG